MTRLVGLYPSDWRLRYEDEFLLLLADRPPDPLERLDIVRGAIDARLHPQVHPAPGAPEVPRPGSPWAVRVGWLTLLGGLLWIATIAVAINGPIVPASDGAYRDGGAALPLYFTAVVLLSIGIGAVGASLPSRARLGRIVAPIAAIGGFGWAFGPWLLHFGLILSVGLVVVGLSAWRSGRWSGSTAALLTIGQIAAWTAGSLIQTGLISLSAVAEVDASYGVFAIFTTAFLAVGRGLVRGGHPSVAASIDTASS